MAIHAARSFGLFAMLTAAACAGTGQKGAEAARVVREHHREKRFRESHALLSQLLTTDRPAAAEAISILLRDPGFDGRSGLVAWVEEAGLKEVLPALLPLLDDPDEDVRYWTVYALGVFQDRRATESLRARARVERERRVAFELRTSLALLGDPYLGYFIGGLRDRDPHRRYACLGSLGRLRDPRSVPPLMRLLDSNDCWEPWHAADALGSITAIEHTITTSVEKRPDGSVQTTGQRRPLEDIRRDCLAWVERHREAAARAVEPSPDAWVFTPEPEVPGFGVSFTMTPDEVARLHDAAGVRYERHRGEVHEENGHAVREPDRIGVERSLWPELNPRLVDIGYSFEGGKLDGIHFRILRPVKPALQLLRARLQLHGEEAGPWLGLGGTVQLHAGACNAEWTSYSLTLRFQE